MSIEMKKVAWFMTAKKVIKFEGADETFTVSDNVMEKSDFKTYPIKKGNAVNVTIEGDTVVFLQKVKAGDPVPETKIEEKPLVAEAPKGEPQPEVKEEPKAEEKKEAPVSEKPVESEVKEPVQVKTITIKAVSKNKEVIKIENADGWIHLSPELQKEDYNTIGILARKTVKATFEGDILVSVEKIAEVSGEDKTSNDDAEKTKYAGDDRQKSIEAQACVNSACLICGHMVGNTPKGADIINKVKRDIATDSFKLIQELKSR